MTGAPDRPRSEYGHRRVQVEGGDLPVADWAPEGSVCVGHFALAIGRPTSAGVQASFGVVSVIGGPWRRRRGEAVEGFVRTDFQGKVAVASARSQFDTVMVSGGSDWPLTSS